MLRRITNSAVRVGPLAPVSTVSTGGGTSQAQVESLIDTQLSSTQLLDHYKENGTEKQHATDDVVKVATGRIAYGETVEQLRTKFPKLDHLLSAMLNVGPLPPDSPTPSPASLTLSNVGETEVVVGTQHVRMLDPVVNLGGWSPAGRATPTGDPDASLKSYGLPSAGLSYTSSGVLGTATGTTFGFFFTPTTLAPVVITSSDVVTNSALNAVTVYNNKGTAITAPAQAEGLQLASSITYTPYAHVYRGQLNNPYDTVPIGNVLGSTTNRFKDNTTEFVIPSYTFGDSLFFPKQPTAVTLFNPLSNEWIPYDDNVLPNSQSTLAIGNIGAVTYWEWYPNANMTSHANPRQMKFKF